jgi:hypothetical protein
MNSPTKTIGGATDRRLRIFLLASLPVVSSAIILLLPPIPQDPAYHNFADTRTFLGVSNFLNVISNLPFLIVGLLGLSFLAKSEDGESAFVERSDRWPYMITFLGLGLTSLGSAYYHLHPDNLHLVWDRLPMTLVFMSLFAAVIGERISRRAGRVLLLPLLAVGIGSVVYWRVTEMAGRGDLRIYAMVQFLSIATILLLVILFPSRYTRGAEVFWVVGIYAMAKIAELADPAVYHLGTIVSGHTLKHVFAAASGYWILRMLWLREPA